MQHFRAKGSHFQHFFEHHTVQTLGFWHNARVGGVDAIDVCVDVAAVGFQRGGNGHS